MASNLRVDTIFPSSGTNVAIGTASGSVTFVGDTDISTNGDVTIGGNLGVGGTLTYEDVTNIDSVGVITARSGIDAASNLLLKTGGTERVRIASDGDVGIGTNAPVERVHIHKPSATGPFLYITNSSTGVSASDGIQIGFDGSNDVVLKNNEPTNLKFYTSASEKLRIASGGALTSTASNNGQIIHKFKNTDTTASSSAMTLEHWFNFNRSGGGMDLSAARIVAGKEREWVGGAANQDGFLAFYTALNESPTEKVRITSDGKLLVGATSSTDSPSTGTGYNNVCTFNKAGLTLTQYGVVASFMYAGIHFTNTQYYVSNNSGTGVYLGSGNTSWTAHSDERLKINITELDGTKAYNHVKTARATSFNWSATAYPTDKKIGFIAQDWETNYPEVVTSSTETIDGVENPKGIQYTETVPVLMAALKKAISKIEVLETEVAALKSS